MAKLSKAALIRAWYQIISIAQSPECFESTFSASRGFIVGLTFPRQSLMNRVP